MSAVRRLTARLAVLVVAGLTPLVAAVALMSGPAVASGFGDNVVGFAARQAGVPYRFGGTTPAGFDCSGLVGYVYAHFGVSLPRTANDQYNAMQHIPRSQAAPGDVIFLPDARGYIYHDGIYAGGNSWWVARHSGTVVQRQPLWTSNYLVGRVAMAAPGHPVYGAIRGKYDSLRGPAGFLGMPTTDELPAAGGGRFQVFQGGLIAWSPRTGAHEVHGAILGTYNFLRGSAGFLGFPLTDEVAMPGGAGSSFQGGVISWRAATGGVTVTRR
ncbi:MAG: NlpC/P60 family protein [Actinomycetota bacterium]|nr:NlpC/P60 family protein [Actinomycetota bacterium]